MCESDEARIEYGIPRFDPHLFGMVVLDCFLRNIKKFLYSHE